MKFTDQTKAETMRAHMEACNQSGFTVSDYSSQNELVKSGGIKAACDLLQPMFDLHARQVLQAEYLIPFQNIYHRLLTPKLCNQVLLADSL